MRPDRRDRCRCASGEHRRSRPRSRRRSGDAPLPRHRAEEPSGRRHRGLRRPAVDHQHGEREVPAVADEPARARRLPSFVNSAVPVLPRTSPSPFSAVAVPSVTTARIIVRTCSSAAGSGAVAGVRTSVGRPGDQLRHHRRAVRDGRADQRHAQRAGQDLPLAERVLRALDEVRGGRHRTGDRRQGGDGEVGPQAELQRRGRSARPAPARHRRWRRSCCRNGRTPCAAARFRGRTASRSAPVGRR